MTSRTEYRVVLERDGLQWPLPTPYNEPTTDRGAAEALLANALFNSLERGQRTFDDAFIVHQEVRASGWERDNGQPWDEQAARDAVLLARNGGQEAVGGPEGRSSRGREVDLVTEASGGLG